MDEKISSKGGADLFVVPVGSILLSFAWWCTGLLPKAWFQSAERKASGQGYFTAHPGVWRYGPSQTGSGFSLSHAALKRVLR